jgi:hypothetical protein
VFGQKVFKEVFESELAADKDELLQDRRHRPSTRHGATIWGPSPTRAATSGRTFWKLAQSMHMRLLGAQIEESMQACITELLSGFALQLHDLFYA